MFSKITFIKSAPHPAPVTDDAIRSSTAIWTLHTSYPYLILPPYKLSISYSPSMNQGYPK